MEQVRKPFQGVLNIIRFNWHLYILSFSLVFLALMSTKYLQETVSIAILIVSFGIVATIIISLIVSFYIYDVSEFYNLNWIKVNNDEKLIVNINAGFDETSYILQNKFNNAEIVALDFYNPEKHTEVSIKRARKAYPIIFKTKQISTANIGITPNSADKIFLIFAAHEIRNDLERKIFFIELSKVIKPTGQIYVVEHLRDLSNFLAYNFGFLHFYSKPSWHKTFDHANLEINQEIKYSPFISIFILSKNGNSF